MPVNRSELVQGIIEAGKRAGHAICGGHISGMFGFFFTDGPVYNFAYAKKSDTTKFTRFFWGMLAEGVYFIVIAKKSDTAKKSICIVLSLHYENVHGKVEGELAVIVKATIDHDKVKRRHYGRSFGDIGFDYESDSQDG
ncbi:hypothetical protein RJT34_04364 [Clitoria ternatea]|uniref:Uncharacterized protein n=1 Tax=Clitoria ternatea TaxID=43366 RepID=A0AAN9Q261_CLITE